MKSLSTKLLFAVPLLIVTITVIAVWYLSRHYVSPKDIRHIVLISIDTCRADYLGCYGYQQQTTPNIDAVARQGILFENVISPVPMTLPAHSSMLTGTIPPYHGVHDNFGYKLNQTNLTLAEMLKNHGFNTGAIIGAFVLAAQFGLDQGFDYYNDHFEEEINNIGVSERRGAEISRFALEWLEKHRQEKFFLFLHYYDPHADYSPPEPFASRFWENPYAGEIAYTDHCIGQVIKKLKELGLYDSTLLIIIGDHGEMLGEHGEIGHSFFIYQEAIKVPLIFKLPGRAVPVKISELVGLVDIAPTVYGLLDLEPPADVKIHGKDLSGCFEGEVVLFQKRHIYCESLTPTKYSANTLLGVVTDRWKFIQTTRPELYDLITDSQETNNLALTRPQQVRLLQESLKQILEEQLGKNKQQSKMELDRQVLEQLKSLGYVSGVVDEDFGFDQTKEDPKDLIDFHNSAVKIMTYISQKKYDQAQNLGNKLLKQRPDFLEGHQHMVKIAIELGDFVGAIDHLSQSINLDPNRYDVDNSLNSLGTLYSYLGQIEQAINYWNQALERNPDMLLALDNLAWIKATHPDEKFYDPEKALPLAQRACVLTNFQDPDYLDSLAAAYAAVGNFSAAVKTAHQAINLVLTANQEKKTREINGQLKFYERGQRYYTPLHDQDNIKP